MSSGTYLSLQNIKTEEVPSILLSMVHTLPGGKAVGEMKADQFAV